MASSEGIRIVLSERGTSGSAWIGVGESFAGFTLEKFNREQERITLRRGAETVELSLKASTVVAGKGAKTAALREPVLKSAGAVARWATDRPKAQAAKERFNAGDITEARRLAGGILAGERHPDDTGRPLHDAHMVLGRIAAKEGRIDDAVAKLLEAARDNRGDPGMNSFGPNMSLAKDLLEHGRSDAVLQYFELCRQFWKSGHKYLDKWAAEIKTGATPNFGANLGY